MLLLPGYPVPLETPHPRPARLPDEKEEPLGESNTQYPVSIPYGTMALWPYDNDPMSDIQAATGDCFS